MPKKSKRKRQVVASSFLFWMTTIGMGMATFIALLAVTTIAIKISPWKIITVWRSPGAASAATDRPGQLFAVYRHNGYQLTNPGGWRVRAGRGHLELMTGDYGAVTGVPEIQAEFTTPDGAVAAVMRCPILETGYAAWDFTTQTRQFERDGATHTATFHLGQPKAANAGAGQIALILMHPGNQLWDNGSANWLPSCQMQATGTAVDRHAFQRVFETLR